MAIFEKDGHILTGIRNTWDTNYHLYDKTNEVEYLIDCDDVDDNLIQLEDIEELKLFAWKTI
jgi:hypothetical protein